MISAIVAVNNDWGIGFNGELLERIPEDLKYFKKLTENNVVVMGRKTWESLPKREVMPKLPNRLNIIISNTLNQDNGIKVREAVKGRLTLAMSLEHFINKFLFTRKDNVFIIGGGQIYKELLPYCDKVYVTKIFKSHENIDTYFPNLDEMENWKPIEKSPIYDYKDIQYQFWQYDKTN